MLSHHFTEAPRVQEEQQTTNNDSCCVYVCVWLCVLMHVRAQLQDILETQGFLGQMEGREYRVLQAETVCLVSQGAEVFQ